MKKYKVYIDLSDGNGYFEVFPVSITPFKKSLEAGELFRRYKWGEITFRNLPHKYKEESAKESPNQNLLNAYRIYDIIRGWIYETEIKIKFVCGTVEIEGYFGYVDCKYNDNNNAKTLKVTPTTIDQYYDFIENYGNSFDLIDGEGSNKIINGDFWQWNGDLPIAWVQEEGNEIAKPKFIKVTTDNDHVAALYPTTPASEFSQSIEVLAGKPIEIEFYWALLLEIANLSLPPGTTITSYADIRDDRKVFITLNDTYQLNADGSWGVIADGIKFADQKLAYYNKDFANPNNWSDFNGFEIFQLVSQNVPEDGTLKINFDNTGYSDSIIMFAYTHEGTDYYVTWDEYTVLLLDRISIEASNIEYIPVEVPIVNVQSEKLKILDVRLPVGGAQDYMVAYPDWNFYGKGNIKAFYFNEDGSPNLHEWEKGSDDPVSLLPKNNSLLNLSKLKELAESTTENSYGDLYMAQLYEITLYTDKHDEKERNFKGRGRGRASKRWRNRTYADITFAYEEAFTNDPAGPDGEGWVQYPGAFDTSKGQRWRRKPFNDENDEAEWEIGELELFAHGEFTEFKLPEGGKGESYIRQRVTSRRKYTVPAENPEDPPVAAELTRTISYGRSLKNVIKLLFNNVHPNYAEKEVYSTFLWNDLEDELYIFDGQNSGMNYVSGQNPNPLNNILLIHTPDFRTVKSTDPKDDGMKISFKEFMDDLKSLFIKHRYGNLYWFIDSNYNLRIEHVIYREMVGYTGQVIPEDINYHNYEYELDEMYSRIIVDQINSGHPDFHKNEITFPKIFTGKRGKEILLESTSKLLTTDLQYCLNNPNDLENGFCLQNYIVNNSGGVTSNPTKVQLATSNMVNGELALSTIIDKYCRKEGTGLKGYVNGKSKVFASTFRTKKAEEITIRKRVDADGNIVTQGIIDGDYFLTLMGSGMVIDLTHDFDQELTRAVLSYAERQELLIDPIATEEETPEFEPPAKIKFDFGGISKLLPYTDREVI